MARVTPTREYVRIIAQELLQAGNTPTQARIRELIFERHGIKSSPNVVGDELERFWKTVGRGAASPSTSSRPASAAPAAQDLHYPLPEELVGWGQDLWRSALRCAQDALRLQDPVEQSKETMRVAALGATVSRLQAANAALSEDLARERAAREGLSADSAALTLKLQEQESRCALLDETASVLRTTNSQVVATYEARLTQVQELYQTQLNQLEADRRRDSEIWEGMRKYLMRETDRIREEQASRVASVQERLDNANLFVEQWRRQVNRLTEDLAAANRRTEEAENRLAAIARKQTPGASTPAPVREMLSVEDSDEEDDEE